MTPPVRYHRRSRGAHQPLLGITIGDFNGIGPETALRGILSDSVHAICHPILIGPIDVYSWYARNLRLPLRFKEIDELPALTQSGWIPVLRTGREFFINPEPGKLSATAGVCAAQAIRTAVQLCRRNMIDAFVTSPVSKEGLHLAGLKYPGQTEMISALSGAKHGVMLLVAGRMRVALATIHLPLRDVPASITRARLRRTLTILSRTLKQDFGIQRPSIAVLGLNPHAGEHGLLGAEEDRVISPAITWARSRGIRAEGPFAADGFFGTGRHQDYDAILAMYHDQGLIPLKMEGFHGGVNYTAGLPIIRTSPDHGTAFSLAGRGIANPSSFIEAIRLASSIVAHRRKHTP